MKGSLATEEKKITQEKLGVLINTEVGVTEWRSKSKGTEEGQGRGEGKRKALQCH